MLNLRCDHGSEWKLLPLHELRVDERLQLIRRAPQMREDAMPGPEKLWRKPFSGLNNGHVPLCLWLSANS